MVAAARAAGDLTVLSGCLAARGRARRALGEIDLAEGDLRRALVAADEAGDADLAADAHLGLAGVLSFAGRPAEAFTHLDRAHLLGSERTRAYVALQRAVVAQRIGRMSEALACYQTALPALRGLAASVDTALVLMNTAVIRIKSGDCRAAIAELTEARSLFAAEDDGYGVAQTEHGLGWAQARLGDLPRALRHLDAAVQRFEALGHQALEVDIDRIEVLLTAGLHVPARELAVRTAQRLHAAGNHSKAAETWLLCARAALLDGDREASAAHAELARRLFAEQGATGWEYAARLEVFRSRDRLVPSDVDDLTALADLLDGAGNASGAASAVALACLAACASGRADDRARVLAAECARRARRVGVVDVHLLAAHAVAAVALAGGDRTAARRRVRGGLELLHRYRSSLAATDARAAVSAHGAGLGALGLRLAVDSGQSTAVFAWMERIRAATPRSIAARPVADLGAVRAVAHRIRESGETDDLLRARQALERAVHGAHLRAPGGRAAGRVPTPTAGQLVDRLAGGTLVEIAEDGGRVVAVTVRAGRPRTRLADLGSTADLHAVAGTIAATLRASVLRTRSSSVELLRRAAGALERMVGGALSGDGPLVLVVPPALHAVPWHLLGCLAGRPVAVAPSATWWFRHQQAPSGQGSAALIAGPRLEEAEAEVLAIAANRPHSTVLVGQSATVDRALHAIERADLAHIACHGRLRRDNPLWSSLELFDGPLCGYDLERLDRTPPQVVLSGCETGVGVRAGAELLGLATALLARGTRSLVASVCPLPDSAVTRQVMVSLHEQLAQGRSAAGALARLATADDEHGLLASCLTAFGTY
jgi:tetratricopeptide (TPR) repeat protein